MSSKHIKATKGKGSSAEARWSAGAWTAKCLAPTASFERQHHNNYQALETLGMNLCRIIDLDRKTGQVCQVVSCPRPINGRLRKASPVQTMRKTPRLCRLVFNVALQTEPPRDLRFKFVDAETFLALCMAIEGCHLLHPTWPGITVLEVWHSSSAQVFDIPLPSLCVQFVCKWFIPTEMQQVKKHHCPQFQVLFAKLDLIIFFHIF